MEVVIPAVVGALASVVVVLLSAVLTARHQRRHAVEAEHDVIRGTYLNPLRYHAVENHFRITDNLHKVRQHGGHWDELDVLATTADLADKDPGWFVSEGARLATATYLTACLLAHLARVRDNVPYLRLTTTADTRLAELTLQVHVGILQDGGMPNVAQISLGQEMWHRDEKRLLTYREFCQLLQKPDRRPWIEPVVLYHLQLGRGENLGRVRLLIDATAELAEFLDGHVGGAESIGSRSEAEHRYRAKLAHYRSIE
ncbi:hypothetical protein [Phytohabitans houttuyneae]|uniref:Uncharacterized protein n=1 Tax=Phytohabitans houttuyneae TaxID=1076126 RepID=A0A6V8KJ74_9ACTN|nr:hypothetical protein [Phytohabitans houttuyneae]GFJ83480.1 hypothetical protein Phou_076600 [Phytohabitans houttuyneae]